MAKEIRTRAVTRELNKNYLRKAEEFYRSMNRPIMPAIGTHVL